MKNAKNTRLHVWELALLLALAAAILWGAASLSRQEDLGRKVIRLHVIANSDSPEDQALKLRVRDRVLARAQELLEQSADMAQAQEVLTSALPELTREAQQVLAA
ncbi:MAG TPA: stage II sporulation protein R, partial [Oscillibacter sp.]|nr:stage II sporulation protein R [Oscillibacter sp.]